MRIKEEKPFPKDLEERLSVVANAVNTELKSVTLLHLDDKPADASEVKARIRATVGGGYLPKANSTFSNYNKTLHDIALVAREIIIRDDGEFVDVGYNLTDAGKKYGLPIAAFTLRYAVNEGRSMFNILGPTNSRGKTRSPYNRIRILEELNKGEKLREADLAVRLELDESVILGHLDALHKISFIRYDSNGGRPRGKFSYRWVKRKRPEDVQRVGRYVVLAKKVAEGLAGLDKEVDYQEFLDRFGYKSFSSILKILTGLVEQGFVQRPLWKQRERSETKILDKGKRFLDYWVLPVRETLDDEIFLVSRDDISSIREAFSIEAIDLYKKISPRINQRRSKERISDILDYLAKNPDSTAREIGDALNLSSSGIRKHLKKIKEKLKSKRKESEVRYSMC